MVKFSPIGNYGRDKSGRPSQYRPKIEIEILEAPQTRYFLRSGSKEHLDQNVTLTKSRGESRTISTFPDFRLISQECFHFILITLIYLNFPRSISIFPDLSRFFLTFLKILEEGNTQFYPFYSQKVRKNRVFHLDN